MFTIKENIKKEMIINKSRFITCIYKIKSVLEVKQILNNIKSEYKDATHYCYAYVINNVKRFNDDNEPSHTAGMPILNVIENKRLNNILVVVIRYFGGVKLGKGGLVRAYSSSVTNALKDDNIIPYKKIIKKRIVFSYNDIKNVDYILKDYNITYKEYDDNVIYEFECEENNYPDKLDSYVIKKDDV